MQRFAGVATPRPRGCPASPSLLTFLSALGRLAPLGSLNAGPLQEHSQSCDCESSSAFLGVRHAGSKWATAVACGGSAVSPRKNGSCAKRNWRGRNPTIMLRRVPQLCRGTIDACGGRGSPLPLRSAPCLCATGTRRPLDPRGCPAFPSPPPFPSPLGWLVPLRRH